MPSDAYVRLEKAKQLLKFMFLLQIPMIIMEYCGGGSLDIHLQTYRERIFAAGNAFVTIIPKIQHVKICTSLRLFVTGSSFADCAFLADQLKQFSEEQP